MSVEKLERVLRRVRRMNPGQDVVLNNDLKKAIMLEVGTDRRTVSSNRQALIKLGWVKALKRQRVELTNEDLGL